MTNASVVIVNYNSGRFLEACVEGVRSSDCSLEIIIVDNASTDGSVNFLNNLTASSVSLRVIRNEENRGFSAGINLGVEHSNSENILLLNPDCLVFPHTIRLLCEALDEDASAGIVGGLVFNFDGSEQRGCRRHEPTLVRSLGKVLRRHKPATESEQVDMTDEPLPKERIYIDAVSGSFLMIRRTTFTAVGGMDEDFFLHFEDLDLCRRIRNAGWKVVFSPDISIFHYQGGSSEQSDHIVSWEKHRSMRRYQRKHHGHNRWLSGLVFLMVWGHFLFQRTMWIFARGSNTLEERKRLPIERTKFPWMTISVGGEIGNRLLVLGVIDGPVRNMIDIGTAMGWSIYASAEGERAQRMTDIHLVHAEYFDKVPARDAPEFNGLLVVSSFSRHVEVVQTIEKFRIRRTAIIQIIGSPDRSVEGDFAKSSEVEASYKSLAGKLMKDKVFDCEIQLFSLSPSKQARGNHSVGIHWDDAIQDCFSWLSK